MEIGSNVLITGAGGFIGSYLSKIFTKAEKTTHQEVDLTLWDQINMIKWDGEIIINCANYGKYGDKHDLLVEKNIAIINNIRRRWPKAKLISFGSGAMYDKDFEIVKAKEYDLPKYPKDLYGLAKRLTVDLSDVTLIIFGIVAKFRFVKLVLEKVEKNLPVRIFQEAKFSWVNLDDLPEVLTGVIENGKGRYNLCGYDMYLSELAKYLGAKEIYFDKPGMALEYTGAKSEIILSDKPNLEALREM